MKVEIRNLSFSYDNKKEILNNVSFNAEDGDFLAVLGSNGAGKSTLFRCMLGFLKNYSGEIFIDDTNIRNFNERELAKIIAYVPQTSEITYDYTVTDIVLMGMANSISVFSSPKVKHKNEALGILKQLGIEEIKDKSFNNISGGEKQLTLIARSLAQGAKIIVLDEPVSALDYGNQYRILNKITRLAKNGYIIIMSTHNPNQALLYSNKSLCLDNGQVLAFGKTDSVLTEENLSKLYNLKISLKEVNFDYGKHYTFCLPLGRERATVSMWTDEMIKFLVDASEYSQYNQILAQLIKEKIIQNSTICDFGCGLGYLSLELSDFVKEVTAIDINKEITDHLIEISDKKNLTVINQDIEKLDIKDKFDYALFNYYGRIKDILRLGKKYAEKKIIIVTRDSEESAFSIDGNSKRKYHSYILEFLNQNNIKYKISHHEIEFGQPFRDVEDAIVFFDLYKKPESLPVTKEDILNKLVIINEDGFKYYYPHKKKLAIILIDVGDISEEFIC